MSEAIKKAQVNGTPAAEVLVERLIGLGEPEFVLLASLVLRSSALDDAAGRWLTSVKGAISDSGEACPR
jgi:hypothetical protein